MLAIFVPPSGGLDTVAEQGLHAGLNGGPFRRNISMEEVAQHRSQEDAWLVHNGKVLLAPAICGPALKVTRP